MVFDISKITGIGDYQKKQDKARIIYYKGEKAFLIENKNTIEIRTDRELSKTLQEKYESVMESRYFGKGGIEIVLADQLSPEEIQDLIRLSFNMTI